MRVSLETLSTPITTPALARRFLVALHEADSLFHLDDDPGEIMRGLTGEPLFTTEEVAFVAARVDEVFKVLPDPHTFCLDLGHQAPETNPGQHDLADAVLDLIEDSNIGALYKANPDTPMSKAITDLFLELHMLCAPLSRRPSRSNPSE